MVFAAPNSDGSYPSGSTPNYTYGGGFQLGVYHETEEGLNLGASFKSTQWMESDTINTTDQNGLPRRESLGVDLPMVLSVGTSYTGLSQWLFALDVRYFDYAHTQGFEHRGYEATGAVKGLGWDSIWSVSPAIQYKPTEKLALRIGYTYNQNPIGSQESIFNVASPLIVEQVLGLGASYAVAENTLLSLTYLKGFENSSSGAFETPNGIVPGTSVTNSTSADAVAMAVTLYY